MVATDGKSEGSHNRCRVTEHIVTDSKSEGSYNEYGPMQRNAVVATDSKSEGSYNHQTKIR